MLDPTVPPKATTTTPWWLTVCAVLVGLLIFPLTGAAVIAFMNAGLLRRRAARDDAASGVHRGLKSASGHGSTTRSSLVAGSAVQAPARLAPGPQQLRVTSSGANDVSIDRVVVYNSHLGTPDEVRAVLVEQVEALPGGGSLHQPAPDDRSACVVVLVNDDTVQWTPARTERLARFVRWARRDGKDEVRVVFTAPPAASLGERLGVEAKEVVDLATTTAQNAHVQRLIAANPLLSAVLHGNDARYVTAVTFNDVEVDLLRHDLGLPPPGTWRSEPGGEDASSLRLLCDGTTTDMRNDDWWATLNLSMPGAYATPFRGTAAVVDRHDHWRLLQLAAALSTHPDVAAGHDALWAAAAIFGLPTVACAGWRELAQTSACSTCAK